MKNYIAFVDDHSGSMHSLAKMALADSNANRMSIADAATKERLDTIVSAFGVGLDGGSGVVRKYVISNPNVMREETSWPTPGGTRLYDGIWDAIELHEKLPDYHNPDVSFLIFVTTDGRESHSKRNSAITLRRKIEELQATGRWTFVARMPRGAAHHATTIGIPAGNVLEWETTREGMAKATVATQAATTAYYTARSAGARSSSSFYTNAAAVDVSKLTDITSEVSLYQVPNSNGTARLRIDDFILSKRSKFLKGAAFVQLVKTEPKIGPKKIVLIRERQAPHRIFAGKEARQMIGMPTDPTSNARVHPGDHGNYDIFIQSESLNRLLPDNVGVIYWEKQGVPFTQEDIDKFAPKAPAAAPAVPVLPAVVGNTRPTASPIPKAAPKPYQGPTVNGRPVNVFSTRQEARDSKTGTPQRGSVVVGNTIYGWYTFK